MQAPSPSTSAPLAPSYAPFSGPSSSHQPAPTPPSHGWRGEGTPSVPHSTPSFVTELRSRLNRCLVEREPDLFGPHYAALIAFAPKCTEAERRSLRALLPHLHPFTNLFSDEQRQAVIAAKTLHAQHKGLVGYLSVERKLHHLLEQSTTPELQEQLKVLQHYYRAHLRKLLNTQDRKAFLKPKAQLWHHGFFLIDRSLARKLLSCDEAGKISRSNSHGSRPVVQLHGMHLKIGAEGYHDLDPAGEFAVSSLCHLLSPEIMIAAPTAVFSIRMPGIRETVVQASLTVGSGDQRLPSAIPLNELLDVLKGFDLLKNHYGSLARFKAQSKQLIARAQEKEEHV